MADGKNIEIKIAATGGDQAAKEIKKVADASESLGKGGGGSSGSSRQFVFGNDRCRQPLCGMMPF